MMSVATSSGSIRPWEKTDAESLAKYANNQNVSINLRDAFPFPYTIKDARSFLGLVSCQEPVTFYAIATPEEAIGGIGLTLNKDVHRLTAELGYWLAEPFWGKGRMAQNGGEPMRGGGSLRNAFPAGTQGTR